MRPQAKRKSKGITPVLAVVILLLIGVSAATGTWAFLQGMESPIKDKTKSKLEIDLEVKGQIHCENTTVDSDVEEKSKIIAKIENKGEREVEASNTNVFVYDTQGNVVASEEEVDLSRYNWTSVGRSGNLNLTVDNDLAPGSYYDIEVRFVRQDYTWELGRCQAR